MPRLFAVAMGAVFSCSAICGVAKAQEHGPEFRAMWADAFHNGYRTPSQTAALVAEAASGNFNAIIVQVRKRGDAYYESAYEPKAADVSPPEYDPLADLISRAKAADPPIEVHAWIVAYNIWNSRDRDPSQPDHPFLRHSEWLTRDRNGELWDGYNYQFDPGLPEVQDYTTAVVLDLVTRYAVDGIHLDYIRYTGSGATRGSNPWGYHPRVIERFNRLNARSGVPEPSDVRWLQFRRDQVTALVRRIYLATQAARPGTCVSAATITWGAAPASAGPLAFSSTEAYGRILQDWRGWMEEGILDLNIPMIYRRHASDAPSFEAWCDRVKDWRYRRDAAVGCGFYLNSTAESLAQIRLAQRPSRSGKPGAGVAGYSYAVPTTDGISRSRFLGALTDPDIASQFEDPESGPVFMAEVPIPAREWKFDPAFGHVMGTVVTTGGDGLPIDGAEVVVSGETERILTADGNGVFGAVDLPAGRYECVADAPGFHAAEVDIDVDGGGAVAQVVLRLSPVEFALTGFHHDPDLAQVRLTWGSVPGRRYRVEVSPDLETWTAVSGILGAVGEETTYVLASASQALQDARFFRVAEVVE